MKKILIFSFLFMAFFAGYAQKSGQMVSGETIFFAKTSMKNIDATNKKYSGFLNVATGELLISMKMTDFDFPNDLMEKHFNETYLESAKYPVASFKGKITDKIDFAKEGIYDVSATGQFCIHGVAKERTIKGKLTIKNGTATMNANFNVALIDHHIKVPTIAFVKMAEMIQVKVNYVFSIQ